LIFGIPLAVIIGGVIIIALIIMKSGPSQQDRKTRASETRMIQEIHHGLAKMERRIESLETLLLDRGAPHEPVDKEGIQFGKENLR
jgi:phage shock protein B